MTINICVFTESNFEIITSRREIHNTSQAIANIFNIPTETYNKLLIEKVIQHNYYFLYPHGAGMNADLAFYLRGVCKQDYLKRFKDIFANQLTLLTLGGV